MSSRPAASSELRAAIMWLLVAIVLLDAAAIALYYHLDVAEWPQRRQLWFMGPWLAATLVIVIRGLKRVRGARNRALAERRGGM